MAEEFASKKEVLETAAETAESTAETAPENITQASGEEYAKRGGGKTVKEKKSRISYEKKKMLYGYAFIALWIVGTLYMFIIPLITSVHYSLSNTTPVSADRWQEYEGMTGPGIYCEWNNFKNYYDIFNADQDYVPNLMESLSAMPMDTFMILVFSLFIALLLNQKFKARGLVRAI